MEPQFSSSPLDDDDGEGCNIGRNHDSEDANGNTLVAVCKVTSHVVGGGGPSSFEISVSTVPSTGV